MPQELSVDLKYLLRQWGITEQQSSRLTPDSCLVNDLRIKGDDLCDFIELMGRVYEVDFSTFEFDNYSPSEGELLSFGDFFRSIFMRPKPRYRRLPLSVISESIALKRWADP